MGFSLSLWETVGGPRFREDDGASYPAAFLLLICVICVICGKFALFRGLSKKGSYRELLWFYRPGRILDPFTPRAYIQP